jgi:hypothetical protein
MAKRERHACLYPGCANEAINQIGLRLRRPPGPDNVWTHDTGAYLCDEHARLGLALTIDVALHSDPTKLYTYVAHEMGEVIERESELNPEKLPPLA